MKLAILQNSEVMEKMDGGFGLSDLKLYRKDWFYFSTVLAVDLCNITTFKLAINGIKPIYYIYFLLSRNLQAKSRGNIVI